MQCSDAFLNVLTMGTAFHEFPLEMTTGFRASMVPPPMLQGIVVQADQQYDLNNNDSSFT